MKVSSVARALACSTILVSTSAFADDQFSLELEAGTFYDSQLVVDEIDTQVDAGDLAFRLGADAEFEAIDTDAFELEFGYSFGQTLYTDSDEFDLQSHTASVDLGTRVIGPRVGARYAFSHYRLGGDALFDMHSITPSISGFVADELYARAYYQYADKDFSTLDERDATANQLGASIFKFYNDNAGFFSVAGRWEDEDAFDPALDYDGFVIGADWRIPLAGGRGGTRLQLGVDYRDRDYKAVTPSINEIRTEERLRGEAELTVPVTESLSIETGYRYTNRNSNLPSADYNEHRLSAGVLFEL
ncbi:outer membrane beta-barrel protein [Qipengyuania sp. 1XM1-15A]|uniref:outer membrane beta-barrel protein n=1 Tax=Qipengyuania xiamenensis TaxID=2867237 RepID=UPI001C8706F1|nr:outer membrane beta-barrel protein [Qipengyuania xiamenensis]MBX7532043.1 outer membrane beta-barrel protein [Qipengyuania xiamenensis]